MKRRPLEILTGTTVEFQKLFEETVAREGTLPWEVLHIAQLTHEVIELVWFGFFTN